MTTILISSATIASTITITISAPIVMFLFLLGSPNYLLRRIIRPRRSGAEPPRTISMTPKAHVAARRHQPPVGILRRCEQENPPRAGPGCQTPGAALAWVRFYHQVAVSEAPVPEVNVAPDHFQVVTNDLVLV